MTYPFQKQALFNRGINFCSSSARSAPLRCTAKIERIVRERQQQEGKRQDALGLLVNARDEEGNGLSVDELKDQVLTLLFAGHETLTSEIASFCLFMAQHPAVFGSYLSRTRAIQELQNAEAGGLGTDGISRASLERSVAGYASSGWGLSRSDLKL